MIGATSSVPKPNKTSKEKTTLQNGVKGELKIGSGLAKKVEKAKSARDQCEQMHTVPRRSSAL
jgi:hypothetical protein